MNSENEIIQHLELSPEAIILGVVSAKGVIRLGVANLEGNTRWTVRFSLCGWRPLGGTLRKSEMTVQKQVSESEQYDLWGVINPYEVIRIKARWSENEAFETPQALLIDFLGKEDSDSELESYSQELQEPVTFGDPILGLFTLDREVDWYRATLDWCGQSIQLTICTCDQDEIEDLLEIAHQLWAQQGAWETRMKNYAATQLLGPKNRGWLKEGEPQLTEEDFINKLVLESILIDFDKTLEFWYDDGDLFFGHEIMVAGTLAEGPQEATIEG